MLDMVRAKEVFDASDDFTVGIEEEFQILDPQTRALTQRYEELRDASAADPALAERGAGGARGPGPGGGGGGGADLVGDRDPVGEGRHIRRGAREPARRAPAPVPARR